jgi:hypothetical protein
MRCIQHHEVRYERARYEARYERLYASIMHTLCMSLCKTLCSAGDARGMQCPGNACGIPIPFFNYNPASYIYFFPTHHPQHLVVVFKCF